MYMIIIVKNYKQPIQFKINFNAIEKGVNS
ncbi:hypothetical protein BCF50_2826 [Chryseobacterium daecheongense]|uniref:Uncharacterized protein n=1 Tax=Chryseobacterium daecheongense TaxID=192389 RepID=A0ABY2FU10_9FLAO|nr:hypothetical protein BCF50_2826 [Chryseobacterium daecheongense]